VPSTPEPEAPPPDAGPVELDDVIVAWGAIVPELSPATRSAVQHAQPLRFDDDVLVFGVAPEMLGAARDRFKSQADIVREALTARLGRRFKFKLEAAPQFSIEGAAARGGADGPPPDGDESNDSGPPPDLVDPDDVTEIPPEADPPPVNRLRDELGATVVEEVPRER
jgi:hypothetical protein